MLLDGTADSTKNTSVEESSSIAINTLSEREVADCWSRSSTQAQIWLPCLNIVVNIPNAEAKPSEQLSESTTGSATDGGVLQRMVALTRLGDSNARLAFLEMLNQGSPDAATRRLVQWLQSDEDSAQPDAARRLMGMLSSNDSESKLSGKMLLAMLNDDKRADAVSVLLHAAGGPGNFDLIQLLRTMRDPAFKSSIDSVVDLLKSRNPDQWLGGLNLLRLLGAEELTAIDNKTLLAMVADGARREGACKIAIDLPDVRQVHRMLQLLAAPPMKNAAAELLNMVDQDKQTAQELLRCLDSKVDTDRRDGSRLLDMLNGGNPENKEIAKRILRLLPSLDQRTRMLSSALAESTKGGVEELLTMLESRPSRRSRDSVYPSERILQLVASQDPREASAGVDLLIILGADRAQWALLEPVIHKLEEPAQLASMVQLLNADRALAKPLISWLSCNDPAESATAISFLNLHADKRGKDYCAKLAAMLKDAQKADQARAILSLGGSEQVIKLLELFEKPGAEKSRAKLMSMLCSETPHEQVAARSLIKLLTSPPLIYGVEENPVDPKKVAERMLKLMAEQANSNLAIKALNLCDQPKKLNRLIDVIESDGATANRLMELMSRPADGGTAGRVLETFSDAKHIKCFLDIVDYSGVVGTRLKGMVESGAALELMKLLTDSDMSQRSIGDSLLRKVSSSSSASQVVEVALNSKLPARDMQQLMDLRQFREDRVAADLLLEATKDYCRYGVSALLWLLRAEDPAAKRAGEKLFSQCNKPEESERVRAILRLTSDPQSLQRLVKIFFDSKSREPAERLLSLLTGSEQEKTGGTALALLLTATQEKSRAHGERVLNLLGSQDAKEQSLGKKLVAQFKGSTALEGFCEITDKRNCKTPEEVAAADRLVEMMNSADANDRRSVEHLVLLHISSDSGKEYAKGLLNSLGSKEQQHVEALLRQIERPTQLETLVELVGSARRAYAGKQLTHMLLSGDPAQASSARAFLDFVRDGYESGAKIDPADRKNYAPIALLDRLSNPEFAAEAKKALLLVTSELMLRQTINPLCETPEGRKILNRVGELSHQPEQRRVVQVIVGAQLAPRFVYELLNLVDDPLHRESTAVLLDMLESGDDTEIAHAEFILDLRLRPEAKKGADSLLNLLAKPEERLFAKELIPKLGFTLVPELMEIFANREFADAASKLKELLTSGYREDTTVVFNLLELRASEPPGKRLESDRLLTMLNTERHRATAIRMLYERPD